MEDTRETIDSALDEALKPEQGQEDSPPEESPNAEEVEEEAEESDSEEQSEEQDDADAEPESEAEDQPTGKDAQSRIRELNAKWKAAQEELDAYKQAERSEKREPEKREPDRYEQHLSALDELEKSGKLETDAEDVLVPMVRDLIQDNRDLRTRLQRTEGATNEQVMARVANEFETAITAAQAELGVKFSDEQLTGIANVAATVQTAQSVAEKTAIAVKMLYAGMAPAQAQKPDPLKKVRDGKGDLVNRTQQRAAVPPPGAKETPQFGSLEEALEFAATQ